MTDKLDKIVLRYEFLTGEISKPEVIADNNTWKKLVKEHSNLTPIIEAYTLYKKTNEELQANLEMSAIETDKEMLALLHEDINYQKKQLEELTEQLKVLLLPKDPNDDKNVIIEIRAGAGGEEAALFANEVRRMYYMFAEKNRWKIEEIGIDENELGGLKEGSFMVVGEGAYSKFKFESGVHRVQRVPDTESQGRIHTSTITVAVLPEAPDVDIEILDKDIKIDTYPNKTFKGKIDSIQRSSGAKSSLFPPENAVGSFVKIVQRIPVKIVFTEEIDPEEFNIVPGMSVVPKVRVR